MQVEDWRLHDAMCSSSGGANNAPQFAGTTELEDPGARLIRIRLNRTRRVHSIYSSLSDCEQSRTDPQGMKTPMWTE